MNYKRQYHVHTLQAKATNATYNEFQALKSGVLQQSNEIVRQSETMLELIRLMRETCLPGILDKPAKHILVCTVVLISDKIVN